MTTSHTAKTAAPGQPGLAPLDNATAFVLARVEQLDARFDQLEQLLRTAHAPTAVAHHLMQLEESMLSRLKFISELMNFCMNKTGGYLQQMSQETAAEDDPVAVAMQAFQLASAVQPEASKGSGAPARKQRRGSKQSPRR